MATSSSSKASLIPGALAAAGTISLAAHLVRRWKLARSSSLAGKRVALILSGCGVYDGSEVTEAVSALVHLSRAGVEVSMYAPDVKQMHVVNHLTGEEVKADTRNVLIESARIARGKVEPLEKCIPEELDAIVIPGGFGAAKNLSTFATAGEEMKVDALLGELLSEFHDAGKPIGVCCIAPTIVAKVLGKKAGCKLTVGSDDTSDEKYPYAGAAGAIKTMGAEHQTCEPHEACIDAANKIVSSSAYMYAGRPDEIDDSVKAMIDGVLSLL